MAEGRYVISRIGQTLIITLEGAADAGALLAASHVLAEIHGRQGAESVVFEGMFGWAVGRVFSLSSTSPKVFYRWNTIAL